MRGYVCCEKEPLAEGKGGEKYCAYHFAELAIGAYGYKVLGLSTEDAYRQAITTMVRLEEFFNRHEVEQ